MPFRCSKDPKHDSLRKDKCSICGSDMSFAEGGASVAFTLAPSHPAKKPCMNCGHEITVNDRKCVSCGCEYLSAETYIEELDPRQSGTSRILQRVMKKQADEHGTPVLHAVLAVDLSSRPLRPPHEVAPMLTQSDPFLMKDQVLTFGRADCWINIPDGGVASKHGEFVRQLDGSYCVRDAGSRHGTFVNGVRLDHDELRKVKPGDEIAVGYWHVIRIQWGENFGI